MSGPNTILRHALAESEDRFRNLIEGSLQGILIHRNWQPLFINQAYASLLGYASPDEVMALGSVEQHLAPYERDRRRRYMEARMRGETAPESYEFDAMRKDGTIVTLQNVVRLVRWDGLPAIQSTVIDVTERRRAEEALRWSEKRFRDFAETAADWFWELDANLCLTYLSERYAEVTGATVADLIGIGHREWLGNACGEQWSCRNHIETLESHRRFSNVELGIVGADGELRVHSISGKPVFDGHGAFQGFRGTGRDITRSHRLSRQLAHQASHDSLTGLVNRREFEERLKRVLESARADGARHALCYMDLDRFKIVNDTWGHMAGDHLLEQVSALLRAQVRGRDTLARLGGDEFGMLMEHCSLEQAERVVESVRKAVASFRFAWQGASFRIGVSIGLVPVSAGADNVADVLSAADNACYLAKERGRNRVHVSTSKDPDLARRREEAHWLTRITAALEEQRLRLDIHPIVALRDEPSGDCKRRVEVQLAMRDGENDIPARTFLPAAERYHMTPLLDKWMLENAMAWLSSRGHEGTALALCFLELSASSIADGDFVEFALELLSSKDAPAANLCLGLHESVLLDCGGAGEQFVGAMKERGCRFALCGFGVAPSTFRTLDTLPVEFIKLDGDVVRDATQSPVAKTLARNVAEIARLTGKRTIAPYVDSPATADVLRAVGIDFAIELSQGSDEPDLSSLR